MDSAKCVVNGHKVIGNRIIIIIIIVLIIIIIIIIIAIINFIIKNHVGNCFILL